MSGLVSSLFDFSFTDFITSRLIKILYVILLIGIGIVSLLMFIGGLSQGGAVGYFMAFILMPIYLVIAVLYARIMCELLIIFFRISETLTEINGKISINQQ